MTNNHSSEQLDSSIKEVLRKTSVPYSSEKWDEMERLLEREPGKYGHSISDYSQYIIAGALGLTLIAGLLFMIFRNSSPEPEPIDTSIEIAPLPDTAIASKNAPQDSVKQTLPSTAESNADSIAKSSSDQTATQEEQSKAEEPPAKKKKSTRDSISSSPSSTKGTDSDTSGTEKKKKKKKKKSGSNKDSILKSANPDEGINFLDNIDKPLPAEEPVKSKDSTR